MPNLQLVYLQNKALLKTYEFKIKVFKYPHLIKLQSVNETH